MSHASNQRNVLGRNMSSSTGGNQRYQSNFAGNHNFHSNSSTMGFQAMPRAPMIYPQQCMMRNHLQESEPMSECSEIDLGVTRLAPTPIRQNQTMAWAGPGPSQPQMTPRRVPYNRLGSQSLPAPPPSPQYLMAPPSPQFVSSFNCDQSFVMQPGPSTSTSRLPAQGPASGKVNIGTKKTQYKPKISSVSRKRFFVGSIDQVVRWHKMAKEAQLYTIYEVAAVLESVSLSSSGVYKMILCSEQKKGTLPLQAVFYPIDRELPTAKIGELVTCVGRMVGTNKMQVFNMWPVSDSLAGLKRVSFLCQRTLQEVHTLATEP
uniref:Uncharacterized protein n=1 Tax=Graphocephala atropunctata TaxID=36148 RepID=A0A1B6MDJ8_9HEMI